jgi:hypothetical protein
VTPLVLGLDTFGDVTHDEHDRPLSHVVAIGAPADLCVLRVPRASAAAAPDAANVAATLVRGQVVYRG